jgi:hypothetical protein
VSRLVQGTPVEVEGVEDFAGLLGCWKIFAETEEVAVRVAEDELIHLPLAWGEGRKDFDSCCPKLGFEWGGGAVGEIEVDTAGVLTFDEVRSGAKVNIELVAGEKGVAVTVPPGMSREAEEAVEVHGLGEILDGENGDDAGYGLFLHFRIVPLMVVINRW